MNFNSLINSRHRDTIIKDLLNLGGNVQQDFLYIPQSEKIWQPTASVDFEFGIDVTLPSSQSSAIGLLGYSQFSGSSNSRWYINIGSTGNITFKPSRFVSISTSVTPYLGQRVTIKGKFIANSGTELYVNDVLVGSSTSAARPTSLGASQEFFIGAFGNAAGDAAQTNTYLNGQIHGWNIDGDSFQLPEGNGFNTVSDLGTTAFGQTSNSGGLSYWNSTVWDSE